jgi:hypothetical protein
MVVSWVESNKIAASKMAAIKQSSVPPPPLSLSVKAQRRRRPNRDIVSLVPVSLCIACSIATQNTDCYWSERRKLPLAHRFSREVHVIGTEILKVLRTRICKPFTEPRNRLPAWLDVRQPH